MADDELTLVSAVASVIAHDLASPIGAAAAAAETAEDPDIDDAFRAEALRLGEDSLRRASATLRFLRAAYGPPTEDIAAVAAAAHEMTASKDVDLDWRTAVTPTPAAARLAALAIHALCAPAHRGGLVVSAAGNGALRIAARAPRLKPDGFAPPSEGPKSAPWRMLAALSEHEGWTFTIEPDGETGLAIHLSPKPA